ncbi:MAG: SDR family oxidoreductase [Clostridia bacterium]|nr:SDR family oxidoreductase [Clostridia bacterium]
MKALITGASSGIGRDMARYLSSIGYDLVIVARRENLLEELKNDLKTNVEIECMDVSIEENCKKLVEKHSDIDILINNAGFGKFGEFVNTDINDEINMINTNIVAVQILTKLYLKIMCEKNRGHILNVASIAGLLPGGPLMSTYYATKSYIVSMTRSISEELKIKNSAVKISVLCPGPVNTNFNNVANVKFSLRGLSSEYVAKYSVDKMLKGKRTIIPGFSIKALAFISKFSPTNIVLYMTYKRQKAKEK